MESKSKTEVCQLLEKIRRQYDFLFRRGFRIVSVLFVGARDEQWQILLTQGNYLIQFVGHEERIDMALGRRELCEDVGLFELHDLISFIERNGTGSSPPDAPLSDALHDFTETAALLEKHIEEILNLLDRIYSEAVIRKVRAIDLNNCPDF